MAFTPNVIAGDKITSAWGNEIRNRTVQVFATAAERAAQWPSPPKGAHSFLSDSGMLYQYSGSAWGGIATDTVWLGAGSIYSGTASITLNPANITGKRVDSYGQTFVNSVGSGTGAATWSDRSLIISSSAAAGVPVGLSMTQGVTGTAVIWQMYTSSQTGYGFHAVNLTNASYVSGTFSNLAVPSERRLKRNISPLEVTGGALGVVEQLQAVSYTLPPPPPIEYPEGTEPEGPVAVSTREPSPSVGFIAEDVAAAGAPLGVVNPPVENTPATIDLMGMIALLTEAIKELTARVVALEGTPA
jgi:hypothetical protein